MFGIFFDVEYLLSISIMLELKDSIFMQVVLKSLSLLLNINN